MSYCTVCGNGAENFDRSRIKGERCEGCGTRRVSLVAGFFEKPTPEPPDLDAIETRVRHAEHESDCQLEMPAIEAPGPRTCTCIVSDAADMLRYLRSALEAKPAEPRDAEHPQSSCSMGFISLSELDGLEADQSPSSVGALKKALEGLLKSYVDLVNAGDAGNWDPETEPEVIAARAALADAARDVERWIRLKVIPLRERCNLCEGKAMPPHKQDCPECDGDGEVGLETDFNEYECYCKTCDGKGFVMEANCEACDGIGFADRNKPIRCDFGGVYLNLVMLDRIRNLPDLRIGLHQADGLNAHFFTFEGGEGLIMPLRKRHEHDEEAMVAVVESEAAQPSPNPEEI